MGRVVTCVPPSVLERRAGAVRRRPTAYAPVKVDYQNNMNLIVVATSVGAGLIPSSRPVHARFPDWFATIFLRHQRHGLVSCSTCCSTASSGTLGPTVGVRRGAEPLTLSAYVLASLYDGDVVVDGKLYDKNGRLNVAGAHALTRRSTDPPAPAAVRSRCGSAVRCSAAPGLHQEGVLYALARVLTLASCTFGAMARVRAPPCTAGRRGRWRRC